MATILLKALTFIVVFALGYALKKKGLFGPKDYNVLKKVMVNVTLPCSVLSAFGGFENNLVLYLVCLLGLGCNIILVFVGYIMSRKKDNPTKAFYMICTGDYNIGAFAMPFAQQLFGPIGVMTTAMFDMGNALMCNGGSYMLTSSMIEVENGEKVTIKDMLKKLFSSVPFCTYVLVLILGFLSIKIPTQLTDFIKPAANAHSFVSMFMVGLMLEINIEKSVIAEVMKVLSLRYVMAAIFAAIFLFVLPFEGEIRRALAVVAFAPLSIIGSTFTEKAGGSPVQASLGVSISILCSVVSMTIMVIGLGVGA